MNPKQLYLGWVRTNHPQVYAAALRTVLHPQSMLAGLGDDLITSVESPDYSGVGLTDAESASIAQAASDANSSGTNWSDLFSSIANAVGTIAPTVIQTQAQQNLLQINTQRAAQGLPPLTLNGQVVTAGMLAPANATMAQLESSLSGSGGLLLIGGLLLLGMLALKGGRSRG